MTQWIRRWWKPTMATLAAFVALACWAVSSPVGSSPDEDFHLASIWCSPAARGDLCEPGTKEKNREVSFAISKRVACYAEDETRSAACQENRKIFQTSKSVVTERGNFLSKYPPVFYATMSLFAGSDVRASVLGMRLFNVSLFCALSLAAWVLVRRRQRFVLGTAWLITLVPLGEFLVASINPSSWTITATGTLFIVALEIFGLLAAGTPLRDNRRGFIALVVVAAVSFVMAGGSRADGAVYAIAASALAFVIARAWKRLGKWTYAVGGGVLLAAGAFLLLTRNTVFTPSELSDSELNAGAPGRAYFVVLGKNVLAIPSLLGQFFGTQGLGWLDTGMPAITTVSATVVFVAVMTWRMVQAQRQTLWILAVGSVAVFALPLLYLQVRNAFVGESFQARYLLPFVVMLAVVALSGGAEPVIHRRIALLMTPVLVLANSAALYANTSRYVQGGKAKSFNLDESMWWWPAMPSPMTVWILGSLAFAIVGVMVMWPAIQERNLSAVPAANVSTTRRRKVSA